MAFNFDSIIALVIALLQILIDSTKFLILEFRSNLDLGIRNALCLT